MFSERLPANLASNRLSELWARLRRAGETVIDLTATNPQDVGLGHDPELLRGAWCDVDLSAYRPEPRGLYAAREAISRAIGGRYRPDELLLAASTSEAYGWLFKLLCAPGDQVLVPSPSYPLFEHLSRLDAVEVIPYRLHYVGGWQLDAREVAQAIGPRTRAILAVSPNNPTGNYLAREELECLASLCGARCALIIDEVFREYSWTGGLGPSAASLQGDGLVFGLGGLSKLAGMPQLKLAWIGVGGPKAARDQALERLEVISDAYLSVSSPVQLAAGELLQLGEGWRARALDRIRSNRAHLAARLGELAPAISLLHGEGGWYAVLRVPALQTEEQIVLGLLEHQRVLVHPGYFFDFQRDAYLVTSLLVAPDTLEGAARALATLCR